MKIFNQKGFGLIEMAVATALLVIGVVGLFTAIANNARIAIEADMRIIALNVARGTLEKILQKRDADSFSNTLAAITSNSYDQNPVTGLTTYVLDTSFIRVNPDADTGLDDSFLDADAGRLLQQFRKRPRHVLFQIFPEDDVHRIRCFEDVLGVERRRGDHHRLFLPGRRVLQASKQNQYVEHCGFPPPKNGFLLVEQIADHGPPQREPNWHG